MGTDTVITGEQNLTVFVRIRPLSADELLNGSHCIVHKIQDKVVILLDPAEDPDNALRSNRSRERQYVFDDAFDGAASQEDVYNTSTRFLIANVVKGYNATVFAYGATGAGKTYTMLGTDQDPGIMSRAMQDLFKSMQVNAEDYVYKVRMSYLEIYNEQIRDLLNPSSGVLDLREDAKGVQVAGLQEIETKNTEEVMDLLTRGNMARTTEPTAANLTSSRSHAVLQITVVQRFRVPSNNEELRTGRLFLIDLAGSERASTTNNRGKRLLEGAHINRSLLALGNCINALVADRGGARYINYRDSKLTRLLKDALGGNCKTVMIAHISPNSLHFEESRNTLLYADRAKHIKTKVHRNVTDVSYHIVQYTNIISELRQEIFRLRNRLEESSLARELGTQKIDAQAVRQHDQLNLLRNQLLSSFQEQMDLRRSIMEFDNILLELTIEVGRNSLMISEWEAEKALRLQNREEKTNDKRFVLTEKEAELRGLDELPDPDEVVAARSELKVLCDERTRTEKLKNSLEKELDETRLKAKNMEEQLPKKVTSEEQKEILTLLCKVHELEIENTEMQSDSFLKEHEIRKRELVISKLRTHRQLCAEIIAKQRKLLDDNKVEMTKELEEILELYQQESVDPMFSLVDIDQHLKNSNQNNSPVDNLLYLNNHSNLADGNHLFSLSSKSRHILEAKSREENFKNGPQLQEIVSSTRGIAAVAAQRRNLHVHHNHHMPNEATSLMKLNSWDNLMNYSSGSSSTTNNNNNNKGGVGKDANMLLETNDDKDDNSNSLVASQFDRSVVGALPASFGLNNFNPTPSLYSKKRTQSFELRSDEKQSNPRKVTDPKLHKRVVPISKVTKRRPVVYAANGRVQPTQFHGNTEVDSNLREFDTLSLGSGTVVYQLQPERGRGQLVHKALRPQDPIYSPLSTPQGKRTARKPPPSIPSYKKADIGITGYSYLK